MILYVSELFDMFIPLAEGKYIITQVDSYSDKLLVSFDHELIEKIFSNLFSNAIKYTPEGESISFRIYKSTADEVAHLSDIETFDSEMFCVSFELINTGTEISPDQAARLFKPFSRSSSQKQLEEFSSGLGLSIVKELVNLLGGTISLLSRTGEVCFRLTLPVQQALFDPLAVDKCKSTGLSYEYARMEVIHLDVNEEEIGDDKKDSRNINKLLIIEDDDDLRNYLKTQLSGSFRVYTAKNGLEGIAWQKK